MVDFFGFEIKKSCSLHADNRGVHLPKLICPRYFEDQMTAAQNEAKNEAAASSCEMNHKDSTEWGKRPLSGDVLITSQTAGENGPPPIAGQRL